MKALALLMLLAVAGCTSPYQQALDNPQLEGSQPPMNSADLEALGPYRQSRDFPD